MQKKTIGFVISHKDGEKRRALLPKDMGGIVHRDCLFFERGYGESVGVSDEEYERAGASVVSRGRAMECDVVCDVKLGDADYLDSLPGGKILFGWAHAVQNVGFTSKMIERGHTVISWENIFEDGRYIFYRNREVAGEAAIMHAYRYCGRMPYDTRVAILGNGQTAKGALRILHGLGATVDVYGRKLEALFRKKMYEYDIIVNCVFWDTRRTDRIIYREDLAKMRKGTMIIDISCDPELEIETSVPTTIANPVYEVDGVIHYTVDNTPAMFPITVTNVLSEGIAPYIDQLVEWSLNDNIARAMDIECGRILNEEILSFREARGLRTR